MTKVRVVVADDHGVVRDGVRMILNSMQDAEVVGEAANGEEAVSIASILSPDIVVMDLSMPGLDGIEAARRIRQSCPSVKVVMLSMHATSEHVYQAFDAGVWGYVLKESAGSELVDAVQKVCAGRRYVTPVLADVVMGMASRFRDMPSKSPMQSLSKREREVFEGIVSGATNSDIAQKLELSPKTVSTYRDRLMVKLHVKNDAEIVKFAVAHGMTMANTLTAAAL